MRYVIRFDDGHYNLDDGWPVDLTRATVYESREAAEAILPDMLDGTEVVPVPEANAAPYTPAEWEAGIAGLRAPFSVLERLEATILALAEKKP